MSKQGEGGRVSADPRRTHNNTLVVFAGLREHFLFLPVLSHASLTTALRDRNSHPQEVGIQRD